MSLDINFVGFNTDKKINNIQHKGHQSFRSKENSEDCDTVEISTQKEDLSKKTKYGIGVGVVTAAAIFGIALALRKKGINIPIGDWKKPLLEKLKFEPLAEHIEFKEASTIEEALQYARGNLKITDIDKDITLEALNWVNKGLTDVSNASKGKVKMPTSIRFKDLKDNTAGNMSCYVRSEDFGRLEINRKAFSHEFLDKRLEQWMYVDGKKMFDENGSYMLINDIRVDHKNRLSELINKYYKNELNVIDKRELYTTFNMIDDKICYILEENPRKGFDIVSKRFPEMNLNVEEFASKTKENQIKELKEIIKRLKDEKRPLRIGVEDTVSPYKTIYHECGHLQDAVLNTEEMLSGDLTEYLRKFATHWYKKENWDKLIAEDKIIKEYSPEFKEFIENEKIQQTAGEVSDYAQSAIGEFIAETYDAMLEGRLLSEDVMNLYLRYKGPIPENMPKIKGYATNFYKERRAA